MTSVSDTIRGYLDANEIAYESPREGTFSLTLPGEKKLQTPVRLDVGEHALGVHAFVCRNPDENHERVYRWLLERNLKTYAVSYAVDHLGDAADALGAAGFDEVKSSVDALITAIGDLNTDEPVSDQAQLLVTDARAVADSWRTFVAGVQCD